MSDDQGRLRISNADREQAIERLQQALDEGRIDLAEFDERTKAAYGAKTNAELDVIFDDLPRDRAADKEVNTIDLNPDERAEREQIVRERVYGRGRFPAWPPLVFISIITIVIWTASSVAAGEPQYFWPIWPILGLSIATCARWMNRGRWSQEIHDQRMRDREDRMQQRFDRLDDRRRRRRHY